MRLDQLIAAHTPYSRKEVKLLLRQKQIKVNDLIIVKADTKVQPEQDTITIKGEPLVLRPSSRYLLLNKPAGYVCATEDARDPTVLELVPDALQCKGLFPAGRLDKDSKGLVLLTSISFILGVGRLAKKRALVQEMEAIEALARVNVLCLDTTGTITDVPLKAPVPPRLCQTETDRRLLTAQPSCLPVLFSQGFC